MHSNLWVGWASIAFHVALITALAVTLPDLSSGAQWLGRAFLFSIPVLFLCGSIYLLVAVKCHRLAVTESHVESQGVWTHRRIALDAVREARWQRVSLGRLVLKTDDRKLAVAFGNYDADSRRALIRFFHFRLPSDVQQGWEKYWATGWRSFDLPEMSEPRARTADSRALRRRASMLWAVFAIPIVIAASISWWFLGVAKVLAMLGLLLVLWLLTRYGVAPPAPPGRLQAKVTSTRVPGVLMLVGVTLFAIGWLAFLAFATFDLRTPAKACLAPTVIGVLLMVWGVALHAKDEKKQIENLAHVAEEEYMHPL